MRIGRYEFDLSTSQAIAVGGIVIGMLAAVSPWFYIDTIANGQLSPHTEFTLSTRESQFSSGRLTTDPYGTSACACTVVGGTFGSVALLLGIGLLLGAAAVALWRRREIREDYAHAMVAAAGVLVLVAPLVLAFSLPASMDADNLDNNPIVAVRWGKDFFGSNTTTTPGTTITYNWGPSWGWIASWVGGLLMIFGGIIELRRPRHTAASAPMPPAPAPYPSVHAPAAPSAPPVPAPAPAAPPAPSSGGAP